MNPYWYLPLNVVVVVDVELDVLDVALEALDSVCLIDFVMDLIGDSVDCEAIPTEVEVRVVKWLKVPANEMDVSVRE